MKPVHTDIYYKCIWSSWIMKKNTNIGDSCMKNLSLHEMKYGNDYTYRISICCFLKNLPSFNDEAHEWQVEEPQRLHLQQKANLRDSTHSTYHYHVPQDCLHEVQSSTFKKHEILNSRAWYFFSYPTLFILLPISCFLFSWSNDTCITWTYWWLIVALTTQLYFQSSVGRWRENDWSKV